MGRLEEHEAGWTSIPHSYSFTMSDLAANQQGKLSQRQRITLVSRFFGAQHTDVWVWLIVITAGPAFCILSEARLWQDEHLFAVIGGLIGWFALVLVLPFAWLWWRVLADLRGPIRRAVGPITVQMETVWKKRQRVPLYSLLIRELAFPIPAEWVGELEDGAPYVVYFAPRTRVLLSLERVSEDYFVGDEEHEHSEN